MRRSTARLVLLLVGAVALAGIPGGHALFGLRGSKSDRAAAAAPIGTAKDARQTSEGAGQAAAGAAKPSPTREIDAADPYPFPPSLEDMQDYEAWEDEKGEIHRIRADRLPSGEFIFPEGIVVPKDPRSMARIVSIMNALGEHFQCLIPALTKPLNPTWLDIPQVPVVEALDSRRAEAALESLTGKCFYRVDGIWTFEFCYKSHIKQMRIDPNGNRLLDEILLGVYSESTPFELLTAPDRLDHTQNLDDEGPAWTSSIMTVYGNGDGADQFGNGWMNITGSFIGSLNPFSKQWGILEGSTVRPRQVGVKYKCLKIQQEGYKQWLESSNVYLDDDHVPFDVQVYETALGIYEMQIRTEKLCEHDLLYQESTLELSQFGNLDDEVVCHSEETGMVYKLKDVPSDDRFWHKFKSAVNPWYDD